MSSGQVVQLPIETSQPAFLLWTTQSVPLPSVPVPVMPANLEVPEEDEHLFVAGGVIVSIAVNRERLQSLAQLYDSLAPPTQVQAFQVDSALDDDDLYPRA